MYKCENIDISTIWAVSGPQIELRGAKSRADAQCWNNDSESKPCMASAVRVILVQDLRPVDRLHKNVWKLRVQFKISQYPSVRIEPNWKLPWRIGLSWAMQSPIAIDALGKELISNEVNV